MWGDGYCGCVPGREDVGSVAAFPRKIDSVLDHGPKNWLATEDSWHWKLHLAMIGTAWWAKRGHSHQGIAA